MRTLFVALALLAASPAVASPQSLAGDPALMPALYGWQQCMFQNVGNGTEDPFSRMERAIMGKCAASFRPVSDLIARHGVRNVDPMALPVVGKAYDAVGRRYVDSYRATKSLSAHPEYHSLGRGCVGCGE